MTEEQPPEIDACAEAVRTARRVLSKWQTDAEDAEQALDKLQDSMGSQVLDNPDSAAELTARMQELRDRISLAEAAGTAARPRVVEAEAAYLLAQADHLEETQLAPVRTALQAHNFHTQGLLAQLEEHEGRYVLETDAVRASYDPGTSGPRHFPAPKSGRLRGAVTILERHIQVLRAVADGRSPQPLMTEWNFLGNVVDYPACMVGPDALVPWREHLDSRAELEALIEA